MQFWNPIYKFSVKLVAVVTRQLSEGKILNGVTFILWVSDIKEFLGGTVYQVSSKISIYQEQQKIHKRKPQQTPLLVTQAPGLNQLTKHHSQCLFKERKQIFYFITEASPSNYLPFNGV